MAKQRFLKLIRVQSTDGTDSAHDVCRNFSMHFFVLEIPSSVPTNLSDTSIHKDLNMEDCLKLQGQGCMVKSA